MDKIIEDNIRENARRFIDLKCSCAQKRVSKATVRAYLAEFAISQVNKYSKNDTST